MARIYAEMFLADTWIEQAPPEVKHRADTTALYRPIIEKYGYTLEDYWASISFYLQDPERFSRILEKSGKILSTELESLRKEQEAAVEPQPEEEAPL